MSIVIVVVTAGIVGAAIYFQSGGPDFAQPVVRSPGAGGTNDSNAARGQGIMGPLAPVIATDAAVHSDSDNRGPMDTSLLRELPRQSLLIAAADRMKELAVDRSVDFAGGTPSLTLAIETQIAASDDALKVSVTDQRRQVIKSFDLKVPHLAQNTPDYGKIAPIIESWGDDQFVPLLTTPATQPAAERPGDDGKVPDEIQTLLASFDTEQAFLAVMRLQQLIAASGESSERLAALVRAYANLAESTRYLYSRHSSVFFARALLYAERLVRLNPGNVSAHAARGYAYTLLGLPIEGQASFARARASGELPIWAQVADDLNHFRTGRLFERVGENDATGSTNALASYFAMLTVEHSGMQAMVINFARLAGKANPHSMRLIDVMTRSSGVGPQHQLTGAYFRTQFDLLKRLSAETGVPPSIRALAAGMGKNSPPDFSPDNDINALLSAMDADPNTPGQLLNWGTYASISRDTLFIAAMRRAYFEARMLNVDPTDDLRAVWPLVKEHRFASVLAGYDRTHTLAGPDTADLADQWSDPDFARRMPALVDVQKDYNKKHPERTWLENYEYKSDETAYDLAAELQAFSDPAADAIALLAVVKGTEAQQLQKLSPEHPAAVAQLIVNRWPETKARAAQIEKDLGDHPQVAFALARAYHADQRYAEAVRLLEQIIKITPDYQAYTELAEVYKDQGNADKWLAIYNTYLRTSEDFGLQHAKKCEEIAAELMRMKRSDRALQYAQESAESGSSWGMGIYAACLTDLGRYDEAEQIEKERQDRYEDSFAWYRWCVTTGRGDRKAADAVSRPHADQIAADNDSDALTEVAVYFTLAGQLDRAYDCLDRASRQQMNPFFQLQMALIALEQGKSDAADTLLEQAITNDGINGMLPPQLAAIAGHRESADDDKIKAYKSVAEEMQRCLSDTKAVTAADLPTLSARKAKGTFYRTNGAYFLGRFFELQGKKEDALRWYRVARDNREYTSSCIPQIAAGLKRLGDAYYP